MADREELEDQKRLDQAKQVEIEAEPESIWSKRRPFLAWLLMCYSTGPTSSMMRSYVVASLQSMTNALGHPKDNPLGRCRPRGTDCFVKFGSREVQSTAYALYLRAIYTSLEGFIAILLMGFADFSNYRKWLMSISVILFGCLAIPSVWLSGISYSNLVGLSIIYCLLLCCNSIYLITEGSYIPVFMSNMVKRHEDREQVFLRRGAKVSVLGLIMGNLGGVTALLVGLIIAQTRGTPREVGYRDFLLAVTISGCVTTILGAIATFGIPSVMGAPLPFKTSEYKFITILKFTFTRFRDILIDLWEYKQAFKYTIAWVLWNIQYSTFMQLFLLSFRETLGIGNSDREYTVWQFMMHIVACIGPFAWMGTFHYVTLGRTPKSQVKILRFCLLLLLLIGTFANIWASLGYSVTSKIGLKNRWEFWLFLVLYVGSSSAIRSINRVAYSAMLPKGKENQYFGLEIMLGFATGWLQSLLVSIIKDKSGNPSAPFIPNTVLMVITIGLYWWCDIEKGSAQVGKMTLFQDDVKS
ncbi:HCL021Cp [Eremothecium sinecaudum]|uniref:Autophagy-related protein n=1 Tax=Eremothecium sinecaudum TaxID=45286 RepID=A0A109UYN5_9SACH|nr:HCL021Cp [Eremothecium sinecaudum]AMD20130.1 HCL021Cp [Eremothecium sinecaudum]